MNASTSSGVVQKAGAALSRSCGTCMLQEPPNGSPSQDEKSKPPGPSTCCGARTTNGRATGQPPTLMYFGIPAFTRDDNASGLPSPVSPYPWKNSSRGLLSPVDV